MKTVVLTLLLLLLTQLGYSQTFTIDSKGIVKCPTAKVGDKGTIFGDTYEAVDNTLLRQRRDQGVDLTKVCTSLVTDMVGMFSGLTFNQPIGNWDVSKVTDMGGMFSRSSFNQPIGNWDVSGVTNMTEMFYLSQFNQPIDNWDVSNVIDMSIMFSSSSFNQPIGKWNVKKVENMKRMFQNTKFNQSLDDWDVSNVVDMSAMFHESQFNQPIGSWNVSKVKDMSVMFFNSKFDQQINNWNTTSVINMYSMFEGSVFNQQINNWKVNNVLNMRQMFQFSQFNQSINNWDTRLVEDMSGMFFGSKFNQPIGNWDVSSVTDMSFMFQNSSFNQNISKWCVSKIKTEPQDFSTASPLTLQNKPLWGNCPGTTPTKTILFLPSNNSTDVFRNVKFSWRTDTLSTKYQLQVFEGFDPIVIDEMLSDTSYINTLTLKGKTEYNWRVRGFNEPKKVYGEWSSVWKFTTQLGTSIVTEEHPTKYILDQNFPNPFNPTTNISFSLPTTVPVRLEILSILGQPLSIPVNQTMSSGNHTITFDGSSLSSGVYLYRLTTPEFTQTRVMSLVK